jgi:hypothetical protein
MCVGKTAGAKKTLRMVREKSAKSEMRKYVAGYLCFQQTPKEDFGSTASK